MPANREVELDVLGPALTAAIFGYYGFFAGLATTGNSGEAVPLYLAFVWTMRIVAVASLACVLLALSGNRKAAPVYLAMVALATVGPLGCAVWDMVDAEYNLATSPLILIVFGIWNGYCLFRTVRELRG